MKVSFYTLGCRLNQAETGLIANSFRDQGYDIVAFGQPSDVCVINSCTVTEQADSDCRKLIRKVLRERPDTYIALVGCYAQTGSQQIQTIDGVDLIVGNQEKLQVAELIAQPQKTGQTRIVVSPITKGSFRIPASGTHLETTRANLKIQDGCDFMCSFCIIPFARGRARSRDFSDIRSEALRLVQLGFQELILTGVNIGTYRQEEKTFLDVVKMLLEMDGIARLRISSIEPTTVTAEIFDLMAHNPRLCPHLHIPLQSGSDKILAQMRRNYTVREFLEFLEIGVAKVPDILLATDIIVGFPGEDTATTQETCELLEKSPLAYAHIFSFSERKGTQAARLPAKVSPQFKKEASQRLHQISEQKKQRFYERFLGKTVRVLIEEQDRQGRWGGFADNYIKVVVSGSDLRHNRLAQVEITGVEDGLAIGMEKKS